MSTNQATITKEFQAGVASPIETLYILYYRQGQNPHPQFCGFYHKSKDMQVVMERAKRHCDLMSYRFVFVRPFIVDLDKVENGMNQ